MTLLGIIKSQAVWLCQLIRKQGPAPRLELINNLVARYQFAKYPSAPEEIAGDLVFRLGSFRGSAIEELAIYGDGVVVNTQATLEIADAFIEDGLQWLKEEYGFEITEYPPLRKRYESQLVVQLNVNLPALLNPMQRFCDKLNELVAIHYDELILCEQSGLYLGFDTTALVGRVIPTGFRLERRLTEPYAANVYYSASPLLTQQHLDLLEELEFLHLE